MDKRVGEEGEILPCIEVNASSSIAKKKRSAEIAELAEATFDCVVKVGTIGASAYFRCAAG